MSREALPAPAWLREVPLAHRGLHAEGIPENSLAAFAAARDAGYGVELDVLAARDRVPVVVHDPVLTRLTGHPTRVAQRTAAELAGERLLDTDHGVPSLGEALGVLGDTPVMVEVKSLRLGAGVLEPAVASVLDDHRGPWCVASFNPASVAWFARHRPDAVRVLTSGGLVGGGLPRPVARRLERLAVLDRVAPHAVSYPLAELPTEATDAWRDRGGAVVAWTATTDAELARAHEVADNVVFEHIRP